jgi:hypothetical protein
VITANEVFDDFLAIMGPKLVRKVQDDPTIPYLTGFLASGTSSTVEGDTLILSWDAPYAKKLNFSKKHKGWGKRVVSNAVEAYFSGEAKQDIGELLNGVF